MHAAWNGNLRAIDSLVDGGAQVDVRNHNGWAALTYAAIKGQDKAVGALLATGADVEPVSVDGRPALGCGLERTHRGSTIAPRGRRESRCEGSQRLDAADGGGGKWQPGSRAPSLEAQLTPSHLVRSSEVASLPTTPSGLSWDFAMSVHRVAGNSSAASLHTRGSRLNSPSLRGVFKIKIYISLEVDS